MKCLVDANVLSEATQLAPNRPVIEWPAAHEGELAVDPFILGEIHLGVLPLRKGGKRKPLEHWFSSITKVIVCLPYDASVGLRWAQRCAALRQKGEAPCPCWTASPLRRRWRTG